MAVKPKTLKELNEERMPPKDSFWTDIQMIGAVLGLVTLACGAVGFLALGVYRAFSG